MAEPDEADDGQFIGLRDKPMSFNLYNLPSHTRPPSFILHISRIRKATPLQATTSSSIHMCLTSGTLATKCLLHYPIHQNCIYRLSPCQPTNQPRNLTATLTPTTRPIFNLSRLSPLRVQSAGLNRWWVISVVEGVGSSEKIQLM